MTSYLHNVQYYETDKMGVTHHSNYIRWMEEARVDYFAKLGFPYHRFEEDKIISLVTNIESNYKRPSTYPDVIEIIINIIDLSPVKLKLGYIMKKGEEIIFTGTSTHCFLDDKNKIVRIDRYNNQFYETLKKLLSTE